MDIGYLGIEDILRVYGTRKLSPAEYMDYVLSRIERNNPSINAFFFVDPDGARAEAKKSATRWSKGNPRGPLDGIPFSVKDHILTLGMPSPVGIRAGANAPAGAQDAPIVARLKEAGAILIGKNTQPELTALSACVSGLYGTGRNPWDLSKTPGGSSGGSGAAVAADMGPLSIGSDSGGSIRIPASYSGVVGLKASFGRIPQFPPAPQAQVHGPMTRKASDLPVVMNAITKPDPSDFYSLPYDRADYTAAFENVPAELRGKRVAASGWLGFGVPTAPGVSAAFRGALDCIRDLGAVVRQVEPFFDYDPYERIAPLIASGFRMLALHSTGGAVETLLPQLQAWAEGGRDVTLPEYYAAKGAEMDVLARIAEAMKDFDYLVTPTTPTTAFAAELCFPEYVEVNRFGHTMSHFPFTWPFNFSGHPAVSVPCGFADGMPVGLQIVAQRGDDIGCISAAIAVEAALGIKPAHPPLFP